MSGAAKAFVVINLVLAVFFASATAMNLALRTDLKGQLDQLQAKYDRDLNQANTEISQLKQTNENLQNQFDTLASEKAGLEERFKSTEAELTLERQNRTELDARLSSLDNSYSELKRDLARLNTRNESLAAELAQAKTTAEEAVAAKEEAIDKMREAETRAEAATAQFRTTAKELQETRDTLLRYRAVYPEPGGRPTPADIYGKVERVDPEPGLVVISVGEEDGDRTHIQSKHPDHAQGAQDAKA